MALKCRLCLSESENFTDVSEVREGFPLSMIAMIICPIKIENDDILPKQICADCEEILLSAYKLRDLSNQNDRYMREYTKDESQEIEILEDVKITEVEHFEDEIQMDDEIPDSEDRNEEEREEIIEEEDEDFIVYALGDEEESTVIELDPKFKFEVECQNSGTKKSAVWNYIGSLTENSEVVESEKDYYYCKICVEQYQTLKPKYKADSVATSVLFTHLLKVHNLNKEDMVENSSFSTPITAAEQVTCELCPKQVHLKSLNIHMAIEHQNGEECRIREKKSQFKVNCFKTQSKSLAWDYFGVLVNEHDEQVDQYYFYCRLCVEEEDKMSPKYTKNTSTSILLQHLKNAHVPKTPEELAKRKLPDPIDFDVTSKRAKTSSKDFQCSQCGDKFELKKLLNRHLVSVHDEEQPRDFTCEVDDCEKSFSTRDIMLKHVRTFHSGSKFPCHQCPAVLSSRMSLRRHIESCHLKLKTFACKHCDAAYQEMKSLKNHVQKVHLGIVDNKFGCEICEMKFPSQWSLRRHQMTHTTERPHQCPHSNCTRNYLSKGDLAKHISKTHKDSVYKCDECPAGFRLKSELRDHYKVHYLDDQDMEDDEDTQGENFEVMTEEFIE